MSLSLQKEGSSLLAKLSGELTIIDAVTIYSELMSLLDCDVSLVIEATGVTRVDASIAQLFLFAARCARDCHVEAQSSAWTNALALFGPSSLLPDL